MNRMTDAERSVLVRQLRLSLGDGSKETSIDVVAGGRNYSHADDGSSLDTRSTVDPIYTLSAGNIVSLKSSNAVRVAQAGIDDADGLIFSSEGGAVLDHSGRVKRLGADGALRDTMFSGHKIRTICKGRGKEIWAVDESTEEIAVDADGRTRALTIPGLDDTQHVRAISVSPEGDRLAFSLESSKTCEIRNRHHRNPAWFGWRGGVVGKVVPADLRSIRSVHDDLLQRHHFYLCRAI